MNGIDILWPMIAAACLTLAGMHVVVWITNRESWANLAFAVLAASVAGIAGFELAMMHAETPEQFGTLLRWLLVPVFVGFVAILVFVRSHFGTGRAWLAHATWVTRLGGLVINFTIRPNLIYREITALRHVELLGSPIVVAKAVPSHWLWLAQFSVLLLMAFVVDASLTLWRRGGATERRRACVIGGSLALFILASGCFVALVNDQVIELPYLISLPFLVVVAAMGYELSQDVLRAAQLARELSESERRMELAASAAQLGLWEWDIVRDEIWAADRARQLFGFTTSERLDLGRLLDSVHPGDRDSVSRAVAKAINGDGDFESEYRMVLQGDRTPWIGARGRVEFNAGGKPVRMRFVSIDITARKRAEAEVQHQSAELAHVARVSTMGELAASVAHELNQPLSAILSNAEAAEMFLNQDPPALRDVREILADIRKDDERAGEVIRRMRSLLRKRDMEMQPLELNSVMEDVIRLVAADAGLRKTAISGAWSPRLPAVWGDRVHLQQVFLNLMMNAMEAMSGQAPEKRRLVVRTGLNGDGSVEIAVTDSGPGIGADKLARLFDPFFTTKPNGMGMGLSIARRIVEAHRGRIWAENDVSGGATFRVTLPVSTGVSKP
jgi:two-component system sensor kinase FixL